jgi:hypothetical protein
MEGRGTKAVNKLLIAAKNENIQNSRSPSLISDLLLRWSTGMPLISLERQQPPATPAAQ